MPPPPEQQALPAEPAPPTELAPLAGYTIAVTAARRADEHAVEAAVARLRSRLGAPKIIQTVVKRGYRLALTS